MRAHPQSAVRVLALSVFALSGFSPRMASVTLHTKARQAEYLGGVRRFPVPDDKVPWSVDWPEYQPVDYTAPSVLKGPVWADLDIRSTNMTLYEPDHCLPPSSSSPS